MLEDKAGFDGDDDWLIIKDTLYDLGEWEKPFCHNGDIEWWMIKDYEHRIGKSS